MVFCNLSNEKGGLCRADGKEHEGPHKFRYVCPLASCRQEFLVKSSVRNHFELYHEEHLCEIDGVIFTIKSRERQDFTGGYVPRDDLAHCSYHCLQEAKRRTK